MVQLRPPMTRKSFGTRQSRLNSNTRTWSTDSPETWRQQLNQQYQRNQSSKDKLLLKINLQQVRQLQLPMQKQLMMMNSKRLQLKRQHMMTRRKKKTSKPMTWFLPNTRQNSTEHRKLMELMRPILSTANVRQLKKHSMQLNLLWSKLTTLLRQTRQQAVLMDLLTPWKQRQKPSLLKSLNLLKLKKHKISSKQSTTLWKKIMKNVRQLNTQKLLKRWRLSCHLWELNSRLKRKQTRSLRLKKPD